ncbi:MAG: MATE family efflux transporter [Spirochaetales bacterium]|nr:MATE family efflux transporter [Spirochaetales bacterium]
MSKSGNRAQDRPPVRETRGVKLLLGEPKKAVIRLALPMVLAMFLASVYNVVDRVWVSGLGENSLSATGYYFPFMILAIAFSIGAGVGGGAAVSQFIGARRRDKASSAAMHTILIGAVFAVLFSVPLVILARPIFTLMGARAALEDTVAYGTIMFAGTVFFMFSQIANALLRSEGSALKAMIAIGAGAVLNAGLDPLFIYVFRLGVAGAAWASILSMALSSLPLVYWLFIERQSYVRFTFRGFRIEGGILGHIANIGVPASLMQGAMAVQMFLITMILSAIGQDRAVAVFTSGWTLVSMAILPLIGIGTAVTSVSAASFGAKAFEKLKVVHAYSVKLGLLVECIIALITGLGAPVIALFFTWAPETRDLAHDITVFLWVIWIFYPATAAGLVSSALFQGVRRGFYSLVITVLRTIVFAVPFAYVMGIGFGWGAIGVYIGIIAASWLSSILAFFWAWWYVRKLNRRPASPDAEIAEGAVPPGKAIPAPEAVEE